MEEGYDDDFDVSAYEAMIGAGLANNEDDKGVTVFDKTASEVEIYKPTLTRETISRFEFVRVMTQVAKYLNSLSDVNKYMSEPEVNTLINPAELAFRLVMSGKLNATLDRLGYEKVTFSELKINPIWISTIEHYYDFRHENEKNELIIPLIGE